MAEDDLSSATTTPIIKMQMPANSLLITSSNIHKLTPNEILSFNSKEYWHKFILENAGSLDKESVLLSVLDSVSPFDLVPVKYTVVGNDAYFLARNCGQAIEKLCINLLPPLQVKDAEVIMTIQSCSIPIEQYKVNMQYYLKKAIEKRYNKNQRGFINLSQFHKDPELFQVLFCPLSKPRFLIYVLSILKRLFSVTAINLSGNNLENLKPLEILAEFKELVCLDLSNNKLKDARLPDFLSKTVPKLQELNLNGNPICSTFKTEIEYLNWINSKMEVIKVIDGVHTYDGMLCRKVYCCSEKPLGIVNKFLEHYFTLYDVKRQYLENTYDRNAILSITCDHLFPNCLKNSKLECYQIESKMLLKVNDNHKVTGVTHQNNSNIANVLQSFPPTKHDPFSFTVDVLYYMEPVIVLVVRGVFKDFQDFPRIRSFSRMFSLKRINENEFKITNDLFHVKNATEDEINNSFLHKKPIYDKFELLTEKEEKNLIEIMSKLTEMNFEYSKRCLEECKWDVKKALEVFLENYKSVKIPPEAFHGNSKIYRHL